MATLPKPESKEVQLARARRQIAEAQAKQREREAQGSRDEGESTEETALEADLRATAIERAAETLAATAIEQTVSPPSEVDECANVGAAKKKVRVRKSKKKEARVVDDVNGRSPSAVSASQREQSQQPSAGPLKEGK